MSTKHGFATRSPHPSVKTYYCWRSMMQRCYGKSSQGYKRYGGRGISVCKRWRDFQNFLSDMGVKPSGLTLERKDNNGNYCKANCRWATQAEQNRNHSKNRRITFRGETKLLSDWARSRGIHKNTLIHRLKKTSVSIALTAPLRQGRELPR